MLEHGHERGGRANQHTVHVPWENMLAPPLANMLQRPSWARGGGMHSSTAHNPPSKIHGGTAQNFLATARNEQPVPLAAALWPGNGSYPLPPPAQPKACGGGTGPTETLAEGPTRADPQEPTRSLSRQYRDGCRTGPLEPIATPAAHQLAQSSTVFLRVGAGGAPQPSAVQ